VAWPNKVALGIAALLAVSSLASAQSDSPQYPNQTVRIVVPVSPGSIADGFARMIAEKLGEFWKQPVVVENRPGLPGVTSVAKSPADGYTLLLNSNGHTIAGALNKNLQFDPVRDFAGVTQVASVPLVMIVPPDLPAKTVKDFIDLAKQKPGQLNFATAGVLSAEIFKQNANINIVHVPYRGAPEAVIAINSSARTPQLPDVPTIAESGLPGYKYESWFGMLAPAGTPQPILDKISQDIAKAINVADVRARMEQQGAVPLTTTPEQFGAIIRNDTERNLRILREAGVAAN
jgi:tripartite-type tricarboxylate transporter receptor subunit TctC